MGWVPADIPDLTGRRAIVTGANAGLGLEVAHGLAAHGAEVVLACRNTAKAEAAAAAIRERTPAAKVDVGRAGPGRPRQRRRVRRRPIRAARPARQQRRADGDRRVPHRAGRRDAVRREPPRALRADRPAAAAAARDAGLAGRHACRAWGTAAPAGRADPRCSAATTAGRRTSRASWPTCCSPPSCSGGWPRQARRRSPWPPTRAASNTDLGTEGSGLANLGLPARCRSSASPPSAGPARCCAR